MSKIQIQKKIIQEIHQGHTFICDGAWGTMLMSRGLSLGECPESWCLSRPEEVKDIAYHYAQAGAEIIETNSFGANRFKLAHYGLEKKVSEINQQAAALTREAVGYSKFVMGSVGPTGKILLMGDISEQELYDAFAEQIVALDNGSADAVCIETMSALDEACLAVKAAKENTSLTVICSFTFEKTLNGEYRTMMGVSPSQMAQDLLLAGADAVGTNCGNGSLQMVEIVREIRKAVKDIPILVRANAGLPRMEHDQLIYPESPADMAKNLSALLEAGANIIGGCCGTTPEHIQALAQQLKVHQGLYDSK